MVTLRRIWTWIKRLWRRPRAEEPEPVPDAMAVGDQGRRPWPLRSPERAFRQRRSGPFYLNMPQYQPCPAGHGWKRRITKRRGGATYWCERCRALFFVRATL